MNYTLYYQLKYSDEFYSVQGFEESIQSIEDLKNYIKRNYNELSVGIFKKNYFNGEKYVDSIGIYDLVSAYLD